MKYEFFMHFVHVKDRPYATGAPLVGYETGTLPFLLKVLSVNKALSIQVPNIQVSGTYIHVLVQAHPDRDLAAHLFRESYVVHSEERSAKTYDVWQTRLVQRPES
jgi:hypothetical protein